MNSLNSAFEGAQVAAGMIAEAVHKELPNPEAARYATYLLGVAARIREGLAERNIDDLYGRDVALLEYPLIELKRFLNAEPSDIHNVTGAYIFARFVREHLSALQSFAKEIDAKSAA